MDKCMKWVRKNNPDIVGRYIFAVIGFVCASFLYVTIAGSNGIKIIAGGGCIMFVATLSLGRYFCEMYLSVENAFANVIKINISEVMRYHSFDVEKYFDEIKKNMWKPVMIIGICAVGMSVLGGFAKEDRGFVIWKAAVFLTVGLIAMAAIYVSYYLKKKIFYYQMSNGNEGKGLLILSILSGVFFVMEIIFWICSSILTLLILWGMLGEWVAPYVDHTKMVFRSYNEGVSFLFLLGGFLAALCLIANYKMKDVWKQAYKATFAIGIIVFIVGIGLTIYDSNVYTEFVDDRFVVYNFGIKADYSMDDIEAFRIYSDEVNEGMQFELTFKNGVVIDTIGSTMTYSDLYEDTYYSEYNFVADYVNKLKEAGISGTIEDVEEIREYVSELDEELIIGFEEIVEIMR